MTVASVPGGYFSPNVARAAWEAGIKVLFTSDPKTCVRSIAGCTVMGWFTVRRGYQADFARKLGTLDPSVLFREWIIWNAKKTIKTLLGAAYPRLMDRRGSYRSVAKS